MRSRKTSSIWRLGGISALVLLSSCLTASRAVAQPGIGVSIEAFDGTLSPYGEWFTVGRLGRVWRPYRAIVGLDFRPYLSGGHWVYTDYGWTFDSDYDWGWAPFHYGRWFLDDYYGWVWVPDTVWGPAWVDWRFGGGYVGWAPLAPVGFAIDYGFYRPAWCFVPTRHFVVRDVYHYALPVDRFHWAYSVTSPIHQPIHHAGTSWNGGPPPGQVSKATGQPIHVASIAPPPPGRIQPVPVASPGGPPAHPGTAPPRSPGSAPPAYAPHPSTPPAPGFAAPAPRPATPPSTPPVPGYAAPAPHPAAPPSPPVDARWGNAPVGGSAHWAPPPAHAAPNPPPVMPSSPHPWVGSPGAGSPAPRPPSEARWGQTPANIAPRWSGGAAPAPSTAPRPSFGGAVSPAAPAPAARPVAPAPRPSFGGPVSPAAPAPAARPVAPAPRIAPAPPSIHPSAPAPRPAPPTPTVKQGFHSPRMYQGAPQIRTASLSAYSRPSGSVAYRSAGAPRSFGSARYR